MEGLAVLQGFDRADPYQRPRVQSQLMKLHAAARSAHATIASELLPNLDKIPDAHLRIFIRHLTDVANELRELTLGQIFDLTVENQWTEEEAVAFVKHAFDNVERLELEALELALNPTTPGPNQPDKLRYDQLITETEKIRENLREKIAELETQINKVDALSSLVSKTESQQRNITDQIATNSGELERTVQAYEKSAPDLQKIVKSLNQVGMQKAFKARSLASFGTKIVWGVLLGIAIALLYHNAAQLISSIDRSAPSINLSYSLAEEAAPTKENGTRPEVTWLKAIARIAIAFPLIWVAWFSARQYGFASKIQEDYDFKVAIARSYEAYKKEATELDPKFKEKLFDSVVNTFSENPLRIYKIQSDPGTPLHEITDSVSKLDKVVDALNKWRGSASK
jgi:DNA repair exonuclease SbcCD ATPase subunit